METSQKRKNKKLEIIPKLEKYVQYMLELLLKLPRTEKYSIGTEYKNSLYKSIECVMILNKVDNKQCIYYINHLDAELNVQRMYLRIMYKNRWIDERKFKICMEQIYELGKMVGGLIKYYGKISKE